MLKFTKGSKERERLIRLCCDTIKGVAHHYDNRLNPTVANDKIRQAFVEIIGTDKLDYKAMRRNNNLITAFEIIEEVIDIKIEEGFRSNPFFKEFAEFNNTAWGDRPEFYVKNPHSIVISEVSGGHWNLNRQRLNAGDSFLVPTKWYGAKVFEEFERMLSGRIDFVELIRKIEESVQEQMAETMATQFMGSFNIIPTEFKHTGNLDVEELLKLIRKVQTANPKATPIIAGTRTALDLLPDMYGQANSFLFSDAMKEEINKTGILQTWRGYKVLEIPQFFRQGTFDNAVADDMLYILTGGEKPIKVLKEGESLIRQNQDGLDNQDMTVEYTFLTKYGVSIILNKYYGAYKITN
ncbi:MAG: hypothetical protein ACLUCH_06090 [Lachnospirales bacterium]